MNIIFNRRPRWGAIALALICVTQILCQAGQPDLSNGSFEFYYRCSACHGGDARSVSKGASLKQLQGRANGAISHGGGTVPFEEINLVDLAAYISSTGAPICAVSGQVTDVNAQSLAGVTVQVSSAYLGLLTPREVTTGADGGYWVDELAPGDYTVTPVSQGVSFYPSQREISVYPSAPNAEEQDFGFPAANGVLITNLVVTQPDQYVSPQGSDWQDGRSWHDAKATLRAALEAAPEGGEVWVAEGFYHARPEVRG